MSRPFNDPSLLTKDRIKRELKSKGVELPRSEQPKAFYVKLYKEHLSPGRVGNGEFSSDDDGYEESPPSKQIVSRSSRNIRKVGSKDIVSEDIKSLSDGDLKEELVHRGQSIGPITPTTRGLYERKLARLRTTTENNGEAVTTLSKSEFSDNDFEEETAQEEQTAPEDEFFYKNSRRGGNSFGSTFTKNFQNTSVQKEVRHDVSVSRNVERSSTVDRKTMNKVRQKKGDKFEEKSWSSASQNEDEEDNYDQENSMSALPASVQRALTSAQRLSPEKKELPQVRERSWRQNTIGKTTQEAPKKEVKETPGKSKKWWIVVFILLLLIALTIAVVLNLERLPDIKAAFSGDNPKQALPPTKA